MPNTKGVYAWYVRTPFLPPPVDHHALARVGEWMLIYVGVAGRDAASRNTLRRRIINSHIKGTLPSTYRASLSALGIDDTRVWLTQNARVAFLPHDEPWRVESACLEKYGHLLPLNINRNTRNPFCRKLSELRNKAGVDVDDE